ncbi:MAG: MCE family protein [Anaerolineaceae bacterium]|nr:MCE family protein [Anaerolineaceae bacterium]
MTEKGRNTAVGVFVIAGFILLGVMIFQFRQIFTLAKGGYEISALVGNSSGIIPGKVVHYLGIEVGQVSEVKLTRDGSMVRVTMLIDDDVDIPSNAQLHTTMGGFGSTFLDIRLPTNLLGRTVPPEPPVSKDDKALIQGITSGRRLIPKTMTDKFEQMLTKFDRLDILLDNLSEMTEKRRLADVRGGKKSPNLSSTIEHFDEMLARVADDENARNLKATLKNLAGRTAELETTIQKIDKTLDGMTEVKDKSLRLVGKLYDDAASLGDLLRTFNSLAKGIQEGQGTVGKMLKSDELHRNLNLLVLQLNQTSQDISRLVRKFEKRGITGKD